MTSDKLSFQTFSALVKTKFQVYLDAVDFIELELAEVTLACRETVSNGTIPGQESFSLVFNGTKDRFLPQRLYVFSNDQLGKFDLFIVPVGQTSDGYQYQAVFNRLIKPA